MKIKIKGKEYEVAFPECGNYKCFVPGEYQHRSLNPGGGSRSTGGVSLCCITNAYHGCPETKFFKENKK